MDILTLGNKIKSRRKALGLTLKDLAGDRVTPAQLSYVETDKCKPSLDLLEYIAQRLGLEMDYLLESERQQVSRFCELNIKISQIDILNGDIGDAQKRLSQVECIAQSYELLGYIGQVQQMLGQILHNQGNYEDASTYYLNALNNFSKVSDEIRIVEIYLLLGLNEYKRRHLRSSLVYFKQGNQYVKHVGDKEILLKLKIEFYLMTVYEEVGERENALYYAEKAGESLKVIGNRDIYVKNMLSEVKDLERLNKIDTALRFADRVIYTFEGTSGLEFVGMVLAEMGAVYSINHMVNEALLYLNKALEIKRLNDDVSLPSTCIWVARTLIKKRDYEEAFKVLNEALNISIKNGNREYEAQAYCNLFEAFRVKGDLIKAEESIRRCCDILEAMGEKEELARCYLMMTEFYKDINREKQAVSCISKAVEIYKNMGTLSNELMKYWHIRFNESGQVN